jgi:hypothetical protein
MFSKEQEAKDFIQVLHRRLEQFGLRLNEDKARVINFTKGKHNVFSFLGFTYFWAVNKFKGWQKRPLYVKTEKNRITKKINEYYQWIKLNRNKMPTDELIDITNAKLQGHYNYFGYYCNSKKLYKSFCRCTNGPLQVAKPAISTEVYGVGNLPDFTTEKATTSIGTQTAWMESLCVIN